MVWPQRSPSAEAASDWPRGSALTPARTISAMTAPLYSVSPVMTPASARYLDGKTSYSRVQEVREDHHDQHGNGAEELDDHRRTSTRTPLCVDSRPTPSRKPSDQREHDRHRRGRQRALDAGQDVGLPQVRREERLPLGGGQLALGVQPRVDHPRHQHATTTTVTPVMQSVAHPGARSRRVEENGPWSWPHLLTAQASSRHRHRLPSQPNNSPSGSVRMTNPSAKMAADAAAPRCSRSSPSSAAPPRPPRSPRRSWCSWSAR